MGVVLGVERWLCDAAAIDAFSTPPVQSLRRQSNQSIHAGRTGEDEAEEVAPVGGGLLPVEDAEEDADDGRDDAPQDEGDPVPLELDEGPPEVDPEECVEGGRAEDRLELPVAGVLFGRVCVCVGCGGVDKRGGG